ncbi:low affinity immunoglobulin gamma Fc region receptor II-like isoform X2 [Mugil cephalus]|uniref:low affinity immunoglobulin gamma Fc region receptor II-like isoform X2 n=1 Tax=Mugil cephalus TaxID=48193 RepID=UPI001FB74798|nr:low affinity immunoglobulin gamma Fc region receptor II-like isoform X2 [Mugil cephalus]
MQLTPFCLVLACLRVSPDRTQFFKLDSISLSCENQVNSTGWRVKRQTEGGGIRACSFGWGSASSGPTCIIDISYPSDSGVYWCESDSGEQSNTVNITVTERVVIMESPCLPVSEGDAVTLRCKHIKDFSDHKFNFYKDDQVIKSNSTGEMTITSASKSDEGLYKCSISGGEESQGSWLAVEASPLSTTLSPPTASSSLSVFRLTCHLVVGVPYLLSTILLGLIYRDRNRAARTPKRGSDVVIMDIVV